MLWIGNSPFSSTAAPAPPVRDPTFYVSGLLELHKLDDGAEQRASWRQSMAALARATTDEGPGPLEGVHPEALVAGVRAALHEGLVDDLDWLAPPAAGSALYELASALPPGAEQRDLGRRVLARLLAADAATFVAVARRMALGLNKGLASPGIRARVALATELPIGVGVADGPLALAVVSRRDLAREWISVASTGSLPSRRLAARLLERAAREVARRAAYGDDHGLRAFKSDAVATAWRRLLSDRESLVWRHVAVARGLLAPWAPEAARAIEEAAAPSLSPTEWRRAAASMAAYVAVDPEKALPLAQRALARGLLDRDPGAASAFMWGLPRAAETEREAAQELLDWVLERAPPEVCEAIVELRTELGESPFADRAAEKGLELLSRYGKGSSDDGAAGLSLDVTRDLEGAVREDKPLRAQIARALLAFATDGAKEAYAQAREALSAAQGALDALEAVTPDEDGAQGKAGSIARRASLSVLRDLDMSLLERDVLEQLLSLGTGGGGGTEQALDPLRDRLAAWILVREDAPLSASKGEPVRPAHPTLSLRRLRALLHLVDSDMGGDDADPQRAARLRDRWLRIARALLERFERGAPSPVRRTIIAALARALDALVRVGACDAVDALLVVSRHVVDPVDLATLGEASMNPDLEHVLERYTRFVRASAGNAAGALAAYEELARELAPDASGRTEALRAVLVRLGGALAGLASATSLRALATDSKPEIIEQLENSLSSLAQLAIGARGRFDPERGHIPRSSIAQLRPLTVSVTRVLTGADSSLREHIVAAALEDLLAGVPKAIAELVASLVWRVAELPVEGAASEARLSVHVGEALPEWLPARRTIGGFYVLRALSSGAVGSVFVVTRDEDRGDANAEKLALKVPEYSANAARQLSEAEFLKMFREEAGALIALPQHPNLARFVTFDAGSKPKPILVMGLVEGVTLERLLETRGLDARRALRVLDDVLRGLEAMHSVGVGHLDLKPSNVVLRRGEEAVLVDFGLAGRHIRPGCATGPYGAPEVWGALDGEVELSPAKADIYAFGCVAFETLTGRVLFDAQSEVAQIAAHVAHDGLPPPLSALAKHRQLASLIELLFATLRRNPRDRPAATMVRKELSRIAPALERAPWPIDAR
jgi:hypothetical protein